MAKGSLWRIFRRQEWQSCICKQKRSLWLFCVKRKVECWFDWWGGCREALVEGDCVLTRVALEGVWSHLILLTLPSLPWHCCSKMSITCSCFWIFDHQTVLLRFERLWKSSRGGSSWRKWGIRAGDKPSVIYSTSPYFLFSLFLDSCRYEAPSYMFSSLRRHRPFPVGHIASH